MKRQPGFIKAFCSDVLTSLDEPVLRRTLREFTLKRELVRQVTVRQDNRVLDLGCGTATLTRLLKAVSTMG